MGEADQHSVPAGCAGTVLLGGQGQQRREVGALPTGPDPTVAHRLGPGEPASAQLDERQRLDLDRGRGRASGVPDACQALHRGVRRDPYLDTAARVPLGKQPGEVSGRGLDVGTVGLATTIEGSKDGRGWHRVVGRAAHASSVSADGRAPIPPTRTGGQDNPDVRVRKHRGVVSFRSVQRHPGR